MKKILIIFMFFVVLMHPTINANATTYTYSNTQNTTVIEEIVYNKLTPIGEYTLTGYCSCIKCCGKNTGITASGTNVQQGRTIAADVGILPFGTKVYIDGNIYTVEDTGGAIRGNRIDIYFNNHQDALNFGLQKKEIYLVEEEIVTMTQVEYLEYTSFTGYLMKNKLATCDYNKSTGETVWTDNEGKIIAHRRKENNLYINSVEQNEYDEWKCK